MSHYYFFFWILFLLLMTKMSHLLSFLLSMEFLVIYILLGIVLVFKVMSVNVFISLFFLSLMACESVIGLVFFVLFSRVSSKDYFMVLSLEKFF